MKYGYARVSTDDQNTDMQLAALKHAGCGKYLSMKEEAARPLAARPCNVA